MKKISILSITLASVFLYTEKLFSWPASVTDMSSETMSAVSATHGVGAVVLNPLSVTNNNNLNFGYIITSGTAGSVTVYPNGNDTTATNNIQVSGGERGQMTVVGSPYAYCTSEMLPCTDYNGNGTLIRITQTPPVALTHTDGETTMAFTPDVGGDITTLDRSGTQYYVQLDSDGSGTVYSGGTLSVGATQKPGVYSAVWPVSFEY